ncbi:MAG: hypothetical protein ACRCVT_14435 [Leadbetterella sp.]
MKKVLLLLITTCFISYIQAQDFNKGDKAINLGLNLGYGWGFGVAGSAEVGIADNISVGAQAGFTTSNYGTFGYNYRLSYINFGGRGNYHFTQFLKELDISVDKLDVYGGVNLNYFLLRYGGDYGLGGYANRGYIGFGGQLGARYKFKDKYGFYAETGFPFTAVGITFGM